ncbi:MAG: hypothetical protein NVSMB55_08890 [Mycobacteriales bacterium]
MLSRFVGAGDHCLDIGCHLGIYAYSFLRLSGPTGKVVGFEPQPVLADYVERSFRKDIATGRFSLVRSALGREPGVARLSLPVEHGKVNRGRASLNDVAGSVESIDVPVVTLDSQVLPEPVSFVKCDVEGFELSVLRGAQDLLARDEPTLLIEIEAQHAKDNVQATFDHLHGLGYQTVVYRQGDGDLGAISPGPDVPARASAWAGHYVYNYFFASESRSRALELTTTS